MPRLLLCFSRLLAASKSTLQEFTFVDLGAGKGRVDPAGFQLSLSTSDWHRVCPRVGNGGDPNISATIRLRAYARMCAAFLGTLAICVFQPGPLVIFMWNPFVGSVFERVLANLEDSLRREPREVYLLYLKPDCAQRLDASPWLHKLWECGWR